GNPHHTSRKRQASHRSRSTSHTNGSTFVVLSFQRPPVGREAPSIAFSATVRNRPSPALSERRHERPPAASWTAPAGLRHTRAAHCTVTAVTASGMSSWRAPSASTQVRPVWARTRVDALDRSHSARGSALAIGSSTSRANCSTVASAGSISSALRTKDDLDRADEVVVLALPGRVDRRNEAAVHVEVAVVGHDVGAHVQVRDQAVLDVGEVVVT